MNRKIGYLVNGIYYRQTPNVEELAEKEQSTYKGWSHDTQRHEHQVDIIQPYQSGQPNEDFILNYPEESKEVYKFTAEAE